MPKHIFVVLLLALTALTAAAIPAARVQKVLTLADGTTVVAYLHGDEHMHYYESEEGVRYRLLSSGLAERICESTWLRMSQHASARRTTTQLRRAARLADAVPMAQVCYRREAGPYHAGTYQGSRKGLVILVEFSDLALAATSTRQEFDNMMNLEGYKRNGHIGSMHDYFHAQSYGQFDLNFDVVGPIKLPSTMKYYGSNNFAGDDLHAAEMIAQACHAVDGQVNFADYDWDGNGEVDQVFVIYAGYSEATGGGANTIWPHEWTLDEAKEFGDGEGSFKLDGVLINTYACSAELKGGSGVQMDGIGTACHEFSHCLGLPDLYDTDGGYPSAFGMDSWSVMDSGNYNSNGCIPAGYTAYERYCAGWLTPIELSEPCYVEQMAPITQKGEAYIIYNKANPTEYFLLQNVQQESWNAGVDGHGLLILHVDYDEEVWLNNTVNNDPNHQRCTIVHADNNTYTSRSGLAGDPFPGTYRNTSFTPTSTPAAQFYNRNASGDYSMGHTITGITEQNGQISFSFDGGSIPVGIASASVTPATEQYYGLDGRQQLAPKSLYIQGGRKYIHK